MHVWLTHCPVFRFVSLLFFNADADGPFEATSRQWSTDCDTRSPPQRTWFRQIWRSMHLLAPWLSHFEHLLHTLICICVCELNLCLPVTLSLSLALSLSLSLSPSHTHTHTVTSWHHCSIERRIFQGKKIPTTVTMNYVITLLSQDYCIISRQVSLRPHLWSHHIFHEL